VAKAAPDGYTLLLMSNANAVSASLFKKLPFDVIQDFVPISSLGFFELVVCVARESRFKSLRELVTHGKANPGNLSARRSQSVRPGTWRPSCSSRAPASTRCSCRTRDHRQ